MAEPLSGLPWLGVGWFGWGSGYVWPETPRALGMCVARDVFVPAGATLTNNRQASRWARLQSGAVVELPPGVPVVVSEPIVGISDDPLWTRRDVRDAAERVQFATLTMPHEGRDPPRECPRKFGRPCQADYGEPPRCEWCDRPMR